jgi:hypothetical protein
MLHREGRDDSGLLNDGVSDMNLSGWAFGFKGIAQSHQVINFECSAGLLLPALSKTYNRGDDDLPGSEGRCFCTVTALDLSYASCVTEHSAAVVIAAVIVTAIKAIAAVIIAAIFFVYWCFANCFN